MATEADLNKLAGIVHVRAKEATPEDWARFKAEVAKPFTSREKKVRRRLHYIQKLHLGQRVAWCAKAGARPREGHVVAVVPPSCHPIRMGYGQLGKRGFWRDHWSYVVVAEGRFWWPRVGTLRSQDAIRNKADDEAPRAGAAIAGGHARSAQAHLFKPAQG